MDERTMVYLDDVVEVIYQALRTPVPDYHKDPFHDSMGVAMAMANELPSAQPERKKGEWDIYIDCEGKTRRCTCKLCGYKTYSWGDLKYCANCGADMRGEQDV